MFDNIGGKIKVLAQVVCWLGIIISVFLGLINFENGGIIVIILGSLFSWVGSFTLYGFGQLIENSDTLVELKKKESNSGSEERITNCRHCGKRIIIPENVTSAICPWCKEEI